MKQIVRYRSFIIPSKLVCEVRITVDDRSVEYSSAFDNGRSTNINLFPIVSLSIQKSSEVDENGNKIRAPWSANDSIGMSKFNLPIFINELSEIIKGMKIQDLYRYVGNRLEVNDKLANTARRVFMIGTTTIEIAPVVIDQLDDIKVEGVKLKFNNEQSSVLLTLNDLTSLYYNLTHMDIDNIAFNIYKTYIMKNNGLSNYSQIKKPTVDIIPKEFE